MMIDALLSFVPLNGNLSLVAAAGVAIPSPGVIDLLGNGVGVAPTSIFGTPSVFGSPDGMGVGGMRPELNITVGTALATATSATLNVQLQAAIDTGAAGGYLPGTYQTIVESGTLTAAQCAANTVIFRCPWLPPFPANLRPRFLRLNFVVPAATLFTAGTISSALVTTVRDDQFNRYSARNYSVV